MFSRSSGSGSSLWRRGSVTVVVASALMVTACGGSSGKAASAGSSSAAGTSAAPTAAGVTSVKATGGGDFCKSLAAAVNSSAASSGGTTPAEIKKTFQDNEANSLKALSKAPSAIKPDVQVIVDTSTKLVAALEKVNWDFSKITPADEATLDSPAFTAATTKVTAYVKAHCGFDIGAGASASS